MQLLLAVALCFVALCFSQQCAGIQDCTSCTALPNCGWCNPTQQCSGGNKTGPSNSLCVGVGAWSYGTGSCIQCGTLNSCRQCNDYGSDCKWCPGSGCVGLGEMPGCLTQHTCPCGEYGDCTSCNFESRGDCLWCTASKKCNTTCPGEPVAHTCPCSANLDCFSCAQTDGCNWCSGTQSCEQKKLGQANCSQTCSDFCQYVGATGCATCQDYRGCAWCKQEGRCDDINTATCLVAHDCPTCHYDTCQECSNDPSCHWCSSGQCQRKDQLPACKGGVVSVNCDTFCAGRKTCDACGSWPGCAWCDQSGTCKDATKPGACALTHTCVVAGPSASAVVGSFFGGMFFVIALVVLAIIALAVFQFVIRPRLGGNANSINYERIKE